MSTTEARRRGIQDAVATADVELSELHGTYTAPTGKTMVGKLIDDGQLPEAIIATSPRLMA